MSPNRAWTGAIFRGLAGISLDLRYILRYIFCKPENSGHKEKHNMIDYELNEERAQFARHCGRHADFAFMHGWADRRHFGRWGRGHEEDPRVARLRGGLERGFGPSRERMFDGGELKLVILKLLSEQPSYGYQLIKTMEERLGGGYSPSAGVIYPTLTLLEEEGLASASVSESNKKVYSLTAEGQAFLEANKERIGELFERIEAVGERFERGRSVELMKAFANLRQAVASKTWRHRVTAEQLKKIAEAINAAAKAIDEL
jgi:DNA-binding PadR family transcriptional regulator